MSNKSTIEAIYAAFGSGDIPAILARMAPDVAWEQPAQMTDAPWLQPRDGVAGVGGFFEALLGIEFHRFEVSAVFEGPGNLVVALINLEGTVKATGVRIAEEDEVHLWWFNAAGQVQRFRHRVDTRQHQLAWAPN